MRQAQVLTGAERKRLLAVIANDRHSGRNRLAVMLGFLAGLRVGEIAALRVNDVVDGGGRAPVACPHATRRVANMPASMCSRIWQWNSQSPGLSATKATSTLSSGSTSTVSSHSRRGLARPSREAVPADR